MHLLLGTTSEMNRIKFWTIAAGILSALVVVVSLVMLEPPLDGIVAVIGVLVVSFACVRATCRENNNG